MVGPPQSRLGDKSMVPADGHGCPGCPHPCIGPAVGGSPDVMVNGMPALRVGDPGIHAACCGPNTWKAKAGSATVFINGKKAHRQGDSDKHCGGTGMMVEGSPNVFTGGGGGGAIGVTISTPAGDLDLSADGSGNIGASMTMQTADGTSVTVGAEGNVVDGTASAKVSAENDAGSVDLGVDSSGKVKASAKVKAGDGSLKVSADSDGKVGVDASYKKVKAGGTYDSKTGKVSGKVEAKTAGGSTIKAGGDSDGGFNASINNGASNASITGKGDQWKASATAGGPNGMVGGELDSDGNWGAMAADANGMGASVNGDADGAVAVNADTGKKVKDFVGDVPGIGNVDVKGGMQVAGEKGPHGKDFSLPVGGAGVVHINDDGQLSVGGAAGGVSTGGSVNLGDLIDGDDDDD